MILYARSFVGEVVLTRMTLLKSIAIVPARGGSKRIPRKNIRLFNGRPIITYSIEAALQAACFEQIIVSTDDEEIADIARAAGASVPFMRSAENSNDFATIADVCREVVQYCSRAGEEFEYICCILPTAPFVSADRLKQGYELLSAGDADSVVPVAGFGYPVQRALEINDAGQMSMIWPEYYNARSQDLKASYHDAGQFYWIKVKSLLEQMRFFSETSLALVLPQMEVQDIDSLEDWQLAEIKYKILH